MTYHFKCKECRRVVESHETKLEDPLCAAEGKCEGMLVRIWSSKVNLKNLKDAH